MTKFLKSTLLRNKLKSNFSKKNLKKATTSKDSEKDKVKYTNKSQIKIEESSELIENNKKITQKENNKNKKQENKTKKEKPKKKEETIQPQLSIESIKEHFYTFNLVPELYTILYTTLIFKWIQTDRVIF
jgi:preprotein translocase subunit SecF